MVKTISTIVFLLMSALTFAQTSGNSNDYYNPDDKPAIRTTGWLKTDRLHTSLSMGTAVGSMYGTRGFASWISPGIDYKLTPKLSISTGLMYTTGYSSNFFTPTTEGWTRTSGGNFSSSLFYIQGSYKMNEKVTLSGATWYEMRTLSEQNDPGLYQRPNANGYMFGMDYKIGKSSKIGFELEMGHGMPSGVYNSFCHQQSPMFFGH
jgi:hypothetical protein